MAKGLAPLAALALIGLAGCTAEPTWAPEAEVQRAIYRHDGPPAVALFTMINNRSDQGAHSGLMVNGSQRVVFDPAGTFNHPQMPERNDVHFGMTPIALDFYIDYHARETYRVVMMEKEITAAQAEQLLRLVQEYGAVNNAACTQAITRILSQVPGFESIPVVLFPERAARAFSQLPGVRTSVHRDDSPSNRGDLIRVPAIR